VDLEANVMSIFAIALFTGQVIKGWDEGVKTMKIGETAELVCHPDYGKIRIF